VPQRYLLLEIANLFILKMQVTLKWKQLWCCRSLQKFR